jgi:hypothetical protein
MNLNLNNVNSNNINSTTAKIRNVNISESLNTSGNTILSNCVFINNNKLGININNPVYTLDIIGSINYTGNLFNNGIKVYTENTNNINQNTNFISNSDSIWSYNNNYDHISYNNKVGIGTSYPTYMLDVVGDTNINGNLIVTYNVNVSKSITCYNLTSNNLITCKFLNVSGNTAISGDIYSNGNITGNNITINSNIICNTINVNNNSYFFSDVTIDGNVIVNGYTNILGNLNINNNKFNVNATTGDVYIDKSLTVNSSIYILDSLTVNGIVTLTNTLYTDNIYINGDTLTATNTNCTFGDITGNNIIGNTISIDNNYINGSLGSLNIYYETDSTDSNTGALIVSGGVGIGADLNVLGNIIGNTSNLQVYTANILNKLRCYSDVQISGNISYKNMTGNIINASSLNILNGITQNCKINNNGNIYTVGTFTIDNTSSFNDDVTINGNLTVTGSTNFTSNYMFKSIKSSNIVGNQIFIDNNNFTINNTNKVVNINYSTPSTSPNTGALVVNGGLGVSENIFTNKAIYSNGIITNSIVISSDFYNITDSNSNIIFIINEIIINQDVSNININSIINGTYFKFLINCNLTGQVCISLNKDLFGMINNNGNYLSISASDTKILLNDTNIGDSIEFYGVQDYFYIKAESSNNYGFLII